MTYFVTKAIPTNNIDSKCHIKKLKSSRTSLIVSCEWYLIAWGRAHTRILTSRTKAISAGTHLVKKAYKIATTINKPVQSVYLFMYCITNDDRITN